MREIKFRGYSEMDKKFYYGGISIFENESYIFDVNCIVNSSVEVCLKSIGQFTGLQDKNGVDIYEGDILEYKNDYGRHHIYKVFKTKGGLVINTHKDDFYRKHEDIHFYDACADMQTSQWIEQCEIIGNIYENTELLK